MAVVHSLWSYGHHTTLKTSLFFGLNWQNFQKSAKPWLPLVVEQSPAGS